MKPYIVINAIGYLLLGMWCAFAPFSTADLIGFSLLGGKGLAEYVAVYGGLQVALGIFFYYCLRSGRYDTALIFGTILYSCLVLFRIGGMLIHQTVTSDMGWILCLLEVAFAVWSWILMRNNRRISAS